MTDNVFVIGDVHGNLDRLEALLRQEGLLGWCATCSGIGETDLYQDGFDVPYDRVDCPVCKGLGWARLRPDVTVVQLGDLADFGNAKRCSSTGDLLCYKYVYENRWADVVLWGNHDRAMVDNTHAFNGFEPNYEAAHYLKMLYNKGRMQMAFEAHGFLITHAGLASAFQQQRVADVLKTDPVAFTNFINDADDVWHETGEWGCLFGQQANAIINAISSRRGGGSSVGGLLWRDIGEGLYDEFRQIFGHSADHKRHQVRYCWKSGCTRTLETHEPSEVKKGQYSYCIDIGGKPKSDPKSNCLAGIWLPSEKVVEVRL